MTYAKYGMEFWDECAHAGLSNGAVRTHAEAIGYLYAVEDTSCVIPKRLVRRFAGSPDWELDVKELAEARLPGRRNSHFWKDRGDAFEVVHHAEVIRQSIATQRKTRARNRAAQAQWRKNHPPGADGQE